MIEPPITEDGIVSNKHGQGTLTNSDGSRYVGVFKDGKKHEQGTQIEPSRKIVGEFKEGLWWTVSVYDNNGNFQFKFVDEER